MHPEIVRNAPGSCPICGMALGRRTVSADQENPDLVSMTRRFWVGYLFNRPVSAKPFAILLEPQCTRKHHWQRWNVCSVIES